MCMAEDPSQIPLLTRLPEVTWVTPFTASVTGFCALLAQGFLGHRVWILTKSKILVAVIGFLSFMGCLGGFIAGIKSGIIAKLGFQTAADIVITVSLASVLSRSRTGFRRTDNILNRLIRGAIQTGTSRVPPITMLDTLNSRRKLKAQFNGTVVDMDTESNAGAYRMQNSKGQVNRSGVAAHTLQSINVTKDVVTVTDAPDVDGDAQIKSSNAWYPQ
ncbi:hypothetical protein V5O48_004176 [Marasmius crinis-equi]|uniref:DUF6534 domain-containing protein n=1 Tax=Marasmius crinis-equi TaxID=585013 RepID=A0ABR3FQT2_9AGAR